jgi:hypothetical protein
LTTQFSPHPTKPLTYFDSQEHASKHKFLDLVSNEEVDRVFLPGDEIVYTSGGLFKKDPDDRTDPIITMSVRLARDLATGALIRGKEREHFVWERLASNGEWVRLGEASSPGNLEVLILGLYGRDRGNNIGYWERFDVLRWDPPLEYLGTLREIREKWYNRHKRAQEGTPPPAPPNSPSA